MTADKALAKILNVMAWIKTLTECGDVAVLIPLAAMILLWLLLIRCPRCAAWWVIAVAFCTGLTGLLKISFYGCPPTPDLHNPSGHTSLSTLVYGTMTLVTATRRSALPRITVIFGGGCFILGIAASRLILRAHSALEVGLGLLVGATALFVFGQRYLRYQTAPVWLSPLFVISGALEVVLRGQQFPAEQLLRAIGNYFRIYCA